MTLQKQIVNINLTSGLDTKSDDKTLPAGKAVTFENCEIKETNKIQKRDGFEELSAVDLSDTSLTGGKGIMTFNNQLVRIKDGALYALSSDASKWVSKGNVSEGLSRSEIADKKSATTPSSDYQPDSAYYGGYNIIGWQEKILVVDSDRQELASTTITSAGVSLFRCLVVGTDLVCISFDQSANKFQAHVFDTTDPGGGLTSTDVITGITPALITFDAYYESGIGILIMYESAANTIRSVWVDSSSFAQLTGSRAPTTIAETGGYVINNMEIVKGPSDYYYVLYYESVSNNFRYFVIDNVQGVQYGPATIAAGGIVEGSINGVSNGSSVDVYFCVAAGASDDTVIQKAQVNASGVVTSASNMVRGLILNSKVFTYNSKNYCVMGYYNFAVGDCSFVYNLTDERISSKNLYQRVKLDPTTQNLYSVTAESSTKFSFPLLEDLDDNLRVIHLSSIDFNIEQYYSAQLGGELLICGGYVSSYDGSLVSEKNFHVYPRMSAGTTSTTSGSLDNAIYQYLAVYEWHDSEGNFHRSAPSVPITVDHSASGTGTNRSVDVTCRNYRFGDKADSDVLIKIYRTEGGGSVFYYLRTTTNDSSATNYTFTDSTGDTALLDNALLYTEGGVLDNIAPPPAERITVFKDRLWLGRLETEGKIYYSKTKSASISAEFSDDLILSIENQGKRVTGLTSIDDKLICTKDDRFYFTYGDGPADTGFNGSFAPFEIRNSDTGCSEGKSLVRVPNGIMMKTLKGIYLIDSNLNTSYIGDAVEDFNTETITSGVMDEKKNRVRFTTEDGNLLEWDYYYQRWYTQTGLDAYDATVWENNYVILRKTAADVIKEVVGTYTDDSVDYLMKIETGWISLAGITQFQRIYKLFFLGERKDSHTFKVSVAYDYDSTYVDEKSIAVDTVLDDGASGYYPFRIEVPLKKQKCQAIKFKFEEVSPSGDKDSFTLTAVGILFGAKRGLSKLRANQIQGVT